MIKEIEYEGKVYLYSPLKKLLLEKEKALKNPIWKFLNKKLKVPIYKPQPFNIKKFTGITIGFTQSCNLGCTYCYANAMPVKSVLSKKLQDRIYRLIQENEEKKMHVSMFSTGESLVYEEEFLSFCERIRSLNSEDKKIRMGIVTNGTLINKNNINRICKIFDTINLSYDGLPDLQNEQRPYVFTNKVGTNDAVENAMHLLGDHDHAFGIRATIGKKSFNRIMEIAEYCSQFKIDYLHLEPLAATKEGSGRGKDEDTFTEEDVDIFVENIKSAFIYLKNKKIDLFTSGIPEKLKIKTTNCGAARPSFRIGSTGVLVGCTRLDGDQPGMPKYYNYGRYDEFTDEFTLDNEAINRLQSMNVDDYEECSDCIAKYHCAGQCHYLRIFDGNIKTLCAITQKLTKWYLFNNNEINKIDFQ